MSDQTEDINLVCVEREKFLSPSDFVYDSPPGGLRARPEFEILGSVVSPLPVPMVDVLAWVEVSTQRLLHDIDMLPYPSPERGVDNGWV